MGPADRHGDPHPPTRGPRGRPCPAARSLSRRPGLRTRDAGPGPRVRRLGRAVVSLRRPGARRAGGRRPPAGRRDRLARAMAAAGPGAGQAARWRDGHQQRVGGAARPGRFPPVPVDGRRRAGDRSAAARRGPAASRPAQGRPPRQQDRHHPAVRRRRPTACRGGLGRDRQSVRPSGQGNPRTPCGCWRACPANGSRWDGRGRLRAGRHDRPRRGRAGGGLAVSPRDRPGRPGRRVPLRDPGDVPRARARAGGFGRPGPRARGAWAGSRLPRRVPSGR
jgi:hypothetical protein